MVTPADIPKLEPCVAATIEALKNLGGSGTNEEIHDQIVSIPSRMARESTILKLTCSPGWQKSLEINLTIHVTHINGNTGHAGQIIGQLFPQQRADLEFLLIGSPGQ